MITKFNKDMTVSIDGMPYELYEAIRTILYGNENSLEEQEDGTYSCNGDVLYVLDRVEKEALDKVDWTF